jgi:type IV secretion system protein VirB4
MIVLRKTTSRPRLSDLMTWGAFVAPGVVLNKDGSLQTSFRFRGPDLASATEAGLAATMARVNNALRRLPSGWALHVEARRRVSDHYPDLIQEPPAAGLIDRERRAQFAESGARLVSDFFMTFSWLLPEDRTAKASRFLFENRPAGAERGLAEQIESFRDTVRQAADLLEPLLPLLEPLDDGASPAFPRAAKCSPSSPSRRTCAWAVTRRARIRSSGEGSPRSTSCSRSCSSAAASWPAPCRAASRRWCRSAAA